MWLVTDGHPLLSSIKLFFTYVLLIACRSRKLKMRAAQALPENEEERENEGAQRGSSRDRMNTSILVLFATISFSPVKQTNNQFC